MNRMLFVLLFSFTVFSAPVYAARPLPDTTAGVHVWIDQISYDTNNAAMARFIAEHFDASQKLTSNYITPIRAYNPNFVVVQYHKAYGVDRGGNITGPTTWSNDIEQMRLWVTNHPEYGAEEDYYWHWTTTIDASHRIQHYWENNIEYYLADLRHTGYRTYVASETIRRCEAVGFDGTFFDCAYFPNYDYEPNSETGRGFDGTDTRWMWYQYPPLNWPSPGSQLSQNWNNVARPFWQSIMNAYHSGGRDYYCLPNCDQMITGWYPDEYLNDVDGGMVERWFIIDNNYDIRLSASRILNYLTGNNKIMIAQTTLGTTAERELRIGMYFLLKNDRSFYNIVNNDSPEWYPEYDIDLGSYTALPSRNLSDMQVAGTQYLYRRTYQQGQVLANLSDSTVSYTLDGTYYRYAFSGGGVVPSNGTKPSHTLTRTTAMSGTISIPSGSVLILWRQAASTSVTPARVLNLRVTN